MVEPIKRETRIADEQSETRLSKSLVATLDPLALELLKQILNELQKANQQLSLITDIQIGDTIK